MKVRIRRLVRGVCGVWLFAVLTTATVVVNARAEDAYQLKVVTDRADAIYEAGQQAEWIVTVTKGNQAVTEGEVSYVVDDFIAAFVATGVPAICDHSGRASGRINGWPKLVPTGEDGKPEPTILEAARYVDAVNFASRCRADAIMSVGFIDAVCPPSSCYAAYNQPQGNKQVINEPLMGHAAPPHIQEAFFKQVQQHVQKKGSED